MMIKADQSHATLFQQANFLLRSKKWEQALQLYNTLWANSPHIHGLLAQNMEYLLRKAPTDSLSENARDVAIRNLEEAGIRQKTLPIKSTYPGEVSDQAEILDRYIRQDIANEKTYLPKEKKVLKRAYDMAAHIGYEAACLYAESHLSDKLKYTVHALRANASLRTGDESSWLFHVNRYLEKFRLPPLRLKEGSSLLSRFSTAQLPSVVHGPLVTVIMPAWNAQYTVGAAAHSILNQTWRNLELIIVDDASTDQTWQILQQLAKADARVKILRNRVNVGPYVSKNIALTLAKGDYVTGHDADDWAHPLRIEQQMEAFLSSNGSLKASLIYMVRMNPKGEFSFKVIGRFSIDGVAHKASISCMFEKKTLLERLGFWDAVRFGADSEMISRAENCLGNSFRVLPQVGMICLDLENSLTNHPLHGVRTVNGGGMSESRLAYRDAWGNLHKKKDPSSSWYLPFPQKERHFEAPSIMVVPYEHQVLNLAGLNVDHLNPCSAHEELLITP